MHIKHRIIIAVALTVLVSPALLSDSIRLTGQLVSDEQLQETLEESSDKYDPVRNFREARQLTREMIDEAEKELKGIAREKATLRQRIAYLQQKIRQQQRKSANTMADLENILNAMRRESANLRDFIRLSHLRSVTLPTAQESGLRLLVQQLVGESLGEEIDDALRDTAIRRARGEIIDSILETQRELDEKIGGLDQMTRAFMVKLIETEALYKQADREYTETQRRIAIARNEVVVSEEQKEEERAVMSEVSAQVRRVQSQLDRVDARVTRQVERDLIRLRLLDPKPGEYVQKPKEELLEEYATEFIWPVKGPISAGFNDARYRRYFGFAHNAVDIVVRQGTPVKSAGDGIVFVVKDGGAKGFSYILIGHGGGYTTLYGHMLELHVQAGQDVKKGQVIGLSGGQPGTRGAGPYTTGAHLHFQVTQDGKYANPLTILP